MDHQARACQEAPQEEPPDGRVKPASDVPSPDATLDNSLALAAGCFALFVLGLIALIWIAGNVD
jgi:hypothetical protein